MKNIIIKQVQSTSNTNGLHLSLSNHTLMEEISAKSNSHNGLLIFKCINTTIKSINASCNKRIGIDILLSHKITILDVHVLRNNVGFNGIGQGISSGITLFNVYSAKNNKGVVFLRTDQVNLVNVIAAGNTGLHVQILDRYNTRLENVTVKNHTYYGIVMGQSFNTILMNVFTEFDGVFIENCSNVSMKNVSVNKIYYTSICILHCENASLEKALSQTFIQIHNNYGSTIDVVDMLAVITVHNTNLFIRNCSFVDNNISSIMATSSIIQAEGDIIVLQ